MKLLYYYRSYEELLSSDLYFDLEFDFVDHMTLK